MAQEFRIGNVRGPQGTIQFTVSTAITSAPSGARINDRIVNGGSSSLTIGGKTLAIGDVAPITTLSPLALGNVEGNFRGPVGGQGSQGIQGPPGPSILNPNIVNGALTLYVSPDGSDTAGDGTSGKPFKTIGKTVEVYNGLVGVSNCTISLDNGTYTDVGNIWSHGILNIKSTSGNNSDVTIRNKSHFVLYGMVLISNITRDISEATAVSSGFMMNSGILRLDNCILIGNTSVDTRGIWSRGGGSLVAKNCAFNNLHNAVLCDDGCSAGIFSASGSGNTFGYVSNASIAFVVANTMLVTSTMKTETLNGEVRGI